MSVKKHIVRGGLVWPFNDGNLDRVAASSLIETVSANELESYRYLRYIPGKLSYAMVEADYLALLRQKTGPSPACPQRHHIHV